MGCRIELGIDVGDLEVRDDYVYAVKGVEGKAALEAEGVEY